MWMVLPTKGCACATCAKIREYVDEEGNLKAPEPFIPKPGDTTGDLRQFDGLDKIAQTARESAERLRAGDTHLDGTVCDC